MAAAISDTPAAKKVGIASCLASEIDGTSLAYVVTAPIALVLDQADLNLNSVLGVLCTGDVVITRSDLGRVHNWILVPSGSFVRHSKMREGRIKLTMDGWMMVNHPLYGELLDTYRLETVKEQFRKKSFLKLPMVKVAAPKPAPAKPPQTAISQANTKLEGRADTETKGVTSSERPEQSSGIDSPTKTELSVDSASRMLDELLDGYMAEDFATSCRKLNDSWSSDKSRPQKMAEIDSLCLRLVVASVIPRYGFEANATGMQTVNSLLPELSKSSKGVGEKHRAIQKVILNYFPMCFAAAPKIPAEEKTQLNIDSAMLLLDELMSGYKSDDFIAACCELRESWGSDISRSQQMMDIDSLCLKRVVGRSIVRYGFRGDDAGMKQVNALIPELSKSSKALTDKHRAIQRLIFSYFPACFASRNTKDLESEYVENHLHQCHAEHFLFVSDGNVRAEKSAESSSLCTCRTGSVICTGVKMGSAHWDGSWVRCSQSAKLWKTSQALYPEPLFTGAISGFVVVDSLEPIYKQTKKIFASSEGTAHTSSALHDSAGYSPKESLHLADSISDAKASAPHLQPMVRHIQQKPVGWTEAKRDMTIHIVSGFGEPWVVEVEQVEVRKSNAYHADLLGTASKGDVLGVRRRKGDWVQLVQDADVRLSTAVVDGVNSTREIKVLPRHPSSNKPQDPVVIDVGSPDQLWLPTESESSGQLLRRCRQRQGGLGKGCLLSEQRLRYYRDVVDLCHRRIFEDNLDTLWEGDRSKLPAKDMLEAKLFHGSTSVVHATKEGECVGGAILKRILVKAFNCPDAMDLKENPGFVAVAYIEDFATVAGSHSGGDMWRAICRLNVACVACHSVLLPDTVDFWRSRGMVRLDSSKDENCKSFEKDFTLSTFGKVRCLLPDLEQALPASNLPLYVWLRPISRSFEPGLDGAGAGWLTAAQKDLGDFAIVG